MRHVLMAAAAALLVFAAMPAYAQYGSSISRSPLSKAQPEEKKDVKTPEQTKKEENAFKDAVGRIPDGKFNPWGKVR